MFQSPNTEAENNVINFLNTLDIDFKFINAKEINRIDNNQFEALYYQGNKELLNAQNIISIIGTRKPSHQGTQTAVKLVADLAKTLNPVFVSGLATGIDTCNMKAAFKTDTIEKLTHETLKEVLKINMEE